jgi:hypothetical protein
MSGAEPPLAKVIPFPVATAQSGSDSSAIGPPPEPPAETSPARVFQLSDYRARRFARGAARRDPRPPDLAA